MHSKSCLERDRVASYRSGMFGGWAPPWRWLAPQRESFGFFGKQSSPACPTIDVRASSLRRKRPGQNRLSHPHSKHAPRSAVGHDTMDRAQRRNSLSVFPRYSRSPSLKLYRRNQGSFVVARVSVTEEAKLRSWSHIPTPMNAAARLRRQDVVINYERRRNRPNQNPKTTNGIGRASHRIAAGFDVTDVRRENDCTLTLVPPFPLIGRAEGKQNKTNRQ